MIGCSFRAPTANRARGRIARDLSLALLAILLSWLVCSMIGVCAAADGAPTPRFKHRVTGLFAPDREQDLRDVVATLPDLKIVSIDYQYAEVTFAYDVDTLFPKATPAQIIERLDNLIRGASRSTFTVKPLSETPRDKLTPVEIPIAGLDCKACAMAAYESVAAIPGVAQATASFKDRRVTALIDPTQTNRAALESALKKKGVTP